MNRCELLCMSKFHNIVMAVCITLDNIDQCYTRAATWKTEKPQTCKYDLTFQI